MLNFFWNFLLSDKSSATIHHAWLAYYAQVVSFASKQVYVVWPGYFNEVIQSHKTWLFVLTKQNHVEIAAFSNIFWVTAKKGSKFIDVCVNFECLRDPAEMRISKSLLKAKDWRFRISVRSSWTTSYYAQRNGISLHYGVCLNE